jgi:hypothetical protein
MLVRPCHSCIMVSLVELVTDWLISAQLRKKLLLLPISLKVASAITSENR